MIEPFLTSSVASLVSDVLRVSLKKLGRKYSVDIKYVLSEKVEEEFQKCLDIAINAFLEFVSQNRNLEQSQQKAILEYFKSSVVTEEIWHLLDPGLEIFDKGLLTKYAHETLVQIFDDSTSRVIFDAWEEFLKAFSFASRSAPELREFLRASYEAGSFKALSNIEDVLAKMDGAINSLKNEELTVSQAIESYAGELKVYRAWAINFQIS
ncbi:MULTISPECIES: hypothetical protein [unclassified Microcoleus]|uniref:hypothetical protein n=1 Tax=unclassified Microcoleus TaxID=2642155 RepID=UPI0025D02716|nr:MULTISPECIES: hypothetical protein [unclassified Microcoleus]